MAGRNTADFGNSNNLYLRGILNPDLDPHTPDDDGNPTTLGFDIQGEITAVSLVPEPSTILLAAPLGLLAVWWTARPRHRAWPKSCLTFGHDLL